jgi:predicted naringenin-chalcone synthase
MTFIRAITTGVPAYKTTADELLSWSETAFTNHRDQRKFRFLVQRSGIGARYSVVPDFKGLTPELFLPGAGNDSLPCTRERLSLFKRNAITLGTEAGNNCLKSTGYKPESITHVIAVSCTGMMAPGLEILLNQSLELDPQVNRMTVNFMGCYAAFHALRLADLICTGDADARVLLVAVELCTLHFRNTGRESDLLSTAIFADGAAAVILEAFSDTKLQTKWLGNISRLINAPDEMSWNIMNDGFEMQLTGNIPGIIEQNIREVYLTLLQKNNVLPEQVDYFAIHPGGKNVLHAFEKAIGIEHEKLRESYQILENYGNMSSPTVLFVLREVIENFRNSAQKRAYVFSAAFGPGITVEAALIKLSKHI